MAAQDDAGRRRSPTRCSPISCRASRSSSANGHTPGLGTILVGDDDAERPLRRHEDGEGAGARAGRRRTSTCPRTRPRPTSSPRSATFNDDPAVDGVPRPAPHAAADRLRGRAARDRPRQGRRRHAPGQHRPARADDARARCRARPPASRRCSRTTRSRSPAARSCILGRGITLGRPLALLLSQKRPTANAAVTVVHTGVPDWPRYTQRADIVVAAAGVPGILQPEHITPGCGRGRRRACATRAASCCPTSTSAARRSPARSRRGSAASAPPRSRCCSATRSKRRAQRGRRERRTVSAERERRTVSAEQLSAEPAQCVTRRPVAAGRARRVCPLCGTRRRRRDTAVATCGMTLAGIDGRAGPFSRGRSGGGPRACS